MEYDKRTYFAEHEEESVKGFTVIDTNESSEQYHIAEKWVAEDSPDKWMQYWIPAAQLRARVKEDKCEPKAQLTNEQYQKVCDMIDHSEVTAGEATA